MHPYSTDDSSLVRTFVWLALLSVGVNELTYGLLAMAGVDSLPSWLDGPSIFAFFGLLFAGMDRWGWRQRFLRWLFHIRTSELAGVWSGEGKSSHDDSRFECRATIKQTWTRIGVRFETKNSVSHSKSASLTMNQVLPQFTFDYLNEPKASATSDLHRHRGTTMLEFDSSGSDSILIGTYFTGRDRRTYGDLKLLRDAG